MIRFWSKVNKNGPMPENFDLGQCWIWTARTNPCGYGTFKYKDNTVLAHRFIYKQEVEDVKPKEEVCHRCDNRACVRLDHLYKGSHKQNMQDMKDRGRAVGHPGESHPLAKLTEKDVLEIRKIWYNSKSKYGLRIVLAEQFNISKRTITKVIRRESWVHL